MKIEWNPQHPTQAIVVESMPVFEQSHPELYAKTLLGRFKEPEKFCRVIRYKNIVSGSFVIPERNHPIKNRMVFSFAIDGKSLYFIGEPDPINKLLDKFYNQYDLDFESPLAFLIGFMNFMIREDVYFLEGYDARLQDLEVDVYENRKAPMEMVVMNTRRDMDILNNYYIQLNAVGETIEEYVEQDSSANLETEITLYLARIQSLLNMVSTIKDYTSEIWNLRQTQLSDQQNKISTLLTIITTIFLPLTLVTGWYGMNFDDMPLIHLSYGYYLIVGLCILIVIGEVLYLRRKRWLTFQDIDGSDPGPTNDVRL